MRITGTRWLLLLLTGIISLSLAGCGGFQLRSKPTAAPTPSGAPLATATSDQLKPTVAPTAEPTAAPAPAATETAEPELALVAGGSAKVSATGGLNVRDTAAASGTLLSKLNVGDIVTVTTGPTEADGYTWWEIDNGKGVTGWVAAGTADDPWLIANAAATAATGDQLLDRAVQLGDKVQVTTQDGKFLNIRKEAGSTAELLAKVPSGTVLTVRSGPVRQDNLLWWELEGESEIRGWAAEGQENDRWLTPMQP